MFTAKNKQTPDDSGSTQGSVSTVGGFGKVLNSIQGLQQRLGDFSIDQVTAAESNANTLIYRITVVQKKLQDLASLKRRLTSATETICQIPEIDFDLIGPDSLERHPQLHAIVKASKIIRLHKLLKVAKASAESVSFDSQIGRLEIGTPLAPVVAPTAAEKFPERSSKISSEAQSAKKPLAWPTDTGELGVIELPPPPPINNENSSHKVELVADIEPQITVSHDAASLPAQTESIVNEVSLAPTHTSPENSAATFEMSSEPAGAAVTAEAIRTPEVKVPSLEDGFKITLAMEPAEPVMQTSTPTESPPPKSETFAFNSAPEFEDERSPAPTDSVFNQRLLDDLIQNYGEFVIAPKSSPKPAPVEVESPISPEPKFVQSEPTSVVKAKTVEVAEVAVPSVRSPSELDRQLKKIIKDYGEYDLYSHQSSLTLKKSGIAAFVVLALVLAGVYFFRSSGQPVSQPASAVQSKPTPESATLSSKESSTAAAGVENGLNQKNNGNDLTPNKIKTKQKP